MAFIIDQLIWVQFACVIDCRLRPDQINFKKNSFQVSSNNTKSFFLSFDFQLGYNEKLLDFNSTAHPSAGIDFYLRIKRSKLRIMLIKTTKEPCDNNIQLFTFIQINQCAYSSLTEPSLRLFIVHINVYRIRLLITAVTDTTSLRQRSRLLSITRAFSIATAWVQIVSRCP